MGTLDVAFDDDVRNAATVDTMDVIENNDLSRRDVALDESGVFVESDVGGGYLHIVEVRK